MSITAKTAPQIISGQGIPPPRLKDDRLPLPPDHERLEIFQALLGLQQGDLGTYSAGETNGWERKFSFGFKSTFSALRKT
jgi:hypothetical protein